MLSVFPLHQVGSLSTLLQCTHACACTKNANYFKMRSWKSSRSLRIRVPCACALLISGWSSWIYSNRENSNQVCFTCVLLHSGPTDEISRHITWALWHLGIHFSSMTRSNITVHIKMWFYSCFMIVRLMLVKLLAAIVIWDVKPNSVVVSLSASNHVQDMGSGGSMSNYRDLERVYGKKEKYLIFHCINQ